MRDRDTFTAHVRAVALSAGRALPAGETPVRAIGRPIREDIVTVVPNIDDPLPVQRAGYQRVIVRVAPKYLNDRVNEVLGRPTDYSPISYAGLPARKHVRWDPAQGKFVVDVIVDAQAIAERTVRSMHNLN